MTAEKAKNEKAEAVKSEEAEKQSKDTVVYQSSVSRAEFILPWDDKDARPIGESNRLPKATAKFNDFRLVLDISDKRKKGYKIHEYLKSHPRYGISHWILEDLPEGEEPEDVPAMMDRLDQMTAKQLQCMLTPEEVIEAGVHPSDPTDSGINKLKYAIIRKKKIKEQ